MFANEYLKTNYNPHLFKIKKGTFKCLHTICFLLGSKKELLKIGMLVL